MSEQKDYWLIYEFKKDVQVFKVYNRPITQDGYQSKQKLNVAPEINNLLSPFVKYVDKLILYALLTRQDVLTALVRCVYDRIKTALASHKMLFASSPSVCIGRRRHVTDVFKRKLWLQIQRNTDDSLTSDAG